MRRDFERRLEKLEAPARAEENFKAVSEARARVRAKVEKLIEIMQSGRPLPEPDGPTEPVEQSPAHERLWQKLQRMHDAMI